MPWFNGAQINRHGQVVLLKTAHKYQLGADLLMVREAAWVLSRQQQQSQQPQLLQQQQKQQQGGQERKLELDMCFSYECVSCEEKVQAVVLPVYTPRHLSQTFIGVATRAADDALKHLLNEATCIRCTQIAADAFYDKQPGTVMTLQFPFTISRMRLKAKAIVGCEKHDRFVVKDVCLTVEYDHRHSLNPSPSPSPSPNHDMLLECERQYIAWLDRTHVRNQAAIPDHPFHVLKQVITAQAIINFLARRGKTVPLPVYEPNVILDPCTPIVFPARARTMKIYSATEQGVGSAAFIEFEKQGGVLVKRVGTSYELHHGHREHQAPLTMNFFGDVTSVQPECPNGGIVMPSLLSFMPTTNSALLNVLRKDLPVFSGTTRCDDHKAVHERIMQSPTSLANLSAYLLPTSPPPVPFGPKPTITPTPNSTQVFSVFKSTHTQAPRAISTHASTTPIAPSSPHASPATSTSVLSVFKSASAQTPRTTISTIATSPAEKRKDEDKGENKDRNGNIGVGALAMQLPKRILQTRIGPEVHISAVSNPRFVRDFVSDTLYHVGWKRDLFDSYIGGPLGPLDFDPRSFLVELDKAETSGRLIYAVTKTEVGLVRVHVDILATRQGSYFIGLEDAEKRRRKSNLTISAMQHIVKDISHLGHTEFELSTIFANQRLRDAIGKIPGVTYIADELGTDTFHIDTRRLPLRIREPAPTSTLPWRTPSPALLGIFITPNHRRYGKVSTATLRFVQVGSVVSSVLYVVHTIQQVLESDHPFREAVFQMNKLLVGFQAGKQVGLRMVVPCSQAGAYFGTYGAPIFVPLCVAGSSAAAGFGTDWIVDQLKDD